MNYPFSIMIAATLVNFAAAAWQLRRAWQLRSAHLAFESATSQMNAARDALNAELVPAKANASATRFSLDASQKLVDSAQRALGQLFLNEGHVVIVGGPLTVDGKRHKASPSYVERMSLGTDVRPFEGGTVTSETVVMVAGSRDCRPFHGES